jgi:hypothetical protein
MGAYHIKAYARKVQGSAPKGHFIEVSFQKDEQASREFSLYRSRDEKHMATIKAETLSGCCGVLVIHHLTMFGNGGADALVNLIEAAAIGGQKAKYGQALLTLLNTSILIPELEHRGWSKSVTFLNGKTNNMVAVLCKTLVQAARPAHRDETGGE